MKRKYNKSDFCEICHNKIKTNKTLFPKNSKNYVEWINYNIQHKKSGFGCLMCWKCYKRNTKPYTMNDFYDECKPNNSKEILLNDCLKKVMKI